MKIIAWGQAQPQGSKTGFPMLVPLKNGISGPGRVYRVEGLGPCHLKVALAEGRRPDSRKRHKAWRENVMLAARTADRGGLQVPLDCPLWIEATFFLRRPKSVKTLYPGSRPDLEKLLRSVTDAIQDSGVITNDARFVEQHLFKRWATKDPCVVIELGPIIELVEQIHLRGAEEDVHACEALETV